MATNPTQPSTVPRSRESPNALATAVPKAEGWHLTRDEVWRLLVNRARTGDAKCVVGVVGAVGVALPGLRHAAHRLSRTYGGDVQAVLVAEPDRSS